MLLMLSVISETVFYNQYAYIRLKIVYISVYDTSTLLL